MSDSWEPAPGGGQPTQEAQAEARPPTPSIVAAGPGEKSPDAFIGRVILDQYRVTKKLGSGGMGTVYIAEQTTVGRKAALKFLLPELGDNEEAVARFYREARSASALSHPNIVQVFNFGRMDDGTLYLAMEYIEGETLAGMLKRGPLATEVLCDLGAQLADGLATAHAAGVVHRDLKPENIIVREINGRLVPKILDFGIAKVVAGDRAVETNLTCDDKIFGTPNYMAPEQAQGKVTAAADIYSLGVIFYAALSGRLPIHAPTPGAQLLALVSAPPEPLAAVLPTPAPAPLEALVMRMLEKEPRKRPRGMLEVRDELLALTPGARVPRRRRGRVIAVLSATLLLAAIGAGGFVARRSLRPKAPPSTPQRVAASHAQPPAWVSSPRADSGSIERLSVVAAVTREHDLPAAELALQSVAAVQAELALASKVNLRGFAPAVYLPVLAAHDAALREQQTLIARGDSAGVADRRQRNRRNEDFVRAMLDERFPGLLVRRDLYWEAYQAGPERWVDASAQFDLDPAHLDSHYYQESLRQKSLELVVTHFFPSLVWVHGRINGAVVLEVAAVSAGAALGLRPGDVIVGVNGQAVVGLGGFRLLSSGIDQTLAERAQRSRFRLTISRAGETKELALPAGFRWRPPRGAARPESTARREPRGP